MFKCLSRKLEIANRPQIYRLSKGKYKEEELIDAGGYSQIWKCEGFAIKRMLIHSQETYLMAKQEINVMKSLPEHPNIVKLIDYGEVKIQNKLFFCIVMELCEMNLQAMLTQEMLTERRIIEIFKQILDGLESQRFEVGKHNDQTRYLQDMRFWVSIK
ncbi:unnamed protein product [Paramecium octaurelia]|uniref:non-specific serine/threonine protein kinase n=1 Tax=Paramecium octaurelia TaxID=43137 RepID=A0A8S1UJF2_PAROT|nr:unnamed protein product [Paramecium octaurelia]